MHVSYGRSILSVCGDCAPRVLVQLAHNTAHSALDDVPPACPTACCVCWTEDYVLTPECIQHANSAHLALHVRKGQWPHPMLVRYKNGVLLVCAACTERVLLQFALNLAHGALDDVVTSCPTARCAAFETFMAVRRMPEVDDVLLTVHVFRNAGSTTREVLTASTTSTAADATDISFPKNRHGTASAVYEASMEECAACAAPTALSTRLPTMSTASEMSTESLLSRVKSASGLLVRCEKLTLEVCHDCTESVLLQCARNVAYGALSTCQRCVRYEKLPSTQLWTLVQSWKGRLVVDVRE